MSEYGLEFWEWKELEFENIFVLEEKVVIFATRTKNGQFFNNHLIINYLRDFFEKDLEGNERAIIFAVRLKKEEKKERKR